MPAYKPSQRAAREAAELGEFAERSRGLMSNVKDTVSKIGSKHAPVAENIIKVVSGGLIVST